MSDPNAVAALLGGSCLMIMMIVVVIILIPAVFYLLTMQKALTLAGDQYRTLNPGLVWLMFIPLFNIVWHFFVVMHVSKSVKAWGTAHGVDFGDGGWGIGLTACILHCCGIIPILGILASLAGLVCIILWWVKVAGFNTTMSRM